MALLQAQLDVRAARLRLYENVVQRRRTRHRRQQGQRRRLWFRPWLGHVRRRQFGLYNQLMFELRAEEPKSCCNFMRMPPEMFDEILLRVRPRITKQHTLFRAPSEPGMKLAITLRYLASGAKYMHGYALRMAGPTQHNLKNRERGKYEIFYTDFQIVFHVPVNLLFMLCIFCTFRFPGRSLMIHKKANITITY